MLTHAFLALKTTPKLQAKVKAGLDDAFSYLGGAVAVSRDKKGRIKKDDGSMANDMAAAGMGGGDSAYTPYVYFEFEIR